MKRGINLRGSHVLSVKQLEKLKSCPYRKLRILERKYYIHMCSVYETPCFNVDKSFCYKVVKENKKCL